ncbi:hypothetical protein RI367_007808 [Sorochytrium milnesiophthora]
MSSQPKESQQRQRQRHAEQTDTTSLEQPAGGSAKVQQHLDAASAATDKVLANKGNNSSKDDINSGPGEGESSAHRGPEPRHQGEL